MRQDALGADEAGTIAEAAVRMRNAVSGADVFAALYWACGGDVCARLDGYAVAMNGRSVHHIAGFGQASPPCFDMVVAWLLADGAPGWPIDPSGVIAERLIAGGRVIGAVVIAVPGLDETVRQRCARLIRLAAANVADLHQRRLSQMVLEALEQSEEAISFYDEADGIIFSNDAYHRVFPHLPDRRGVLGMSHLDLYRLDLAAGVIDDPLARSDPDAYLADRERRSRNLVVRQREIQTVGGRSYIYTRSRSMTGATMSRRIDITEQAATEARLRERERELHALAFLDPLTGLYNRAYLRERLAGIEARAASGGRADVAVFLIDIDGFKILNDTYGHDRGDQVLRNIADRLAHGLPDAQDVVRLGVDEFLVLFERAIDDEAATEIARQIGALISEPMMRDELAIRVGASIGVARSAPGGDLGTLLGDADLAMAEAKRTKGGGVALFEPGLRAAFVARARLVEDVRTALKRGEFEVHYQPQFETRSRRLVGFEALARWRHPDHGMISPAVFIPIMEEYGLIETLGAWVLETACAEASAWPDGLKIAVNVSPLQVRSPRFTLTLADVLMRSGLSPQRLELEITESVFLNDADGARARLEQWKALGVRIALDDFGCGYSSLGYLSALPIDKLKIDRAFLAGFDLEDPTATAGIILRTIVYLGRSLGMTVTAEGVERPDQLDYLARLACSEVQGFLLGRPAPACEVQALISRAGVAVTAA